MDEESVEPRRARHRLRITNTNSGTDSDGGNISGLSMNNFLLVVLGAMAGIMALAFQLMLPAFKETGLVTKIFVACIPVVVTVAYTLLFFHNKPPGYHNDFFSDLFGGPHFNTQMPRRTQVEHPLIRAAKKSNQIASARRTTFGKF